VGDLAALDDNKRRVAGARRLLALVSGTLRLVEDCRLNSKLTREWQLLSLAGFLCVSYAAAALGSAFTLPALNSWYRSLRKPRWTPPNRVFGPVWTTLYTQMALAAWLIWRRRAQDPARARPALLAWAAQLALNVAWSAVFFGRRSLVGGVCVIMPLWAAVAATACLAARVYRPAGLLLLPYLAWTTFAAALNARIWRLNA
jgi:benzodiazapine receptor